MNNVVNIFKNYDQEENRFTNGFISILQLSVCEQSRFLPSFLKGQLSLAPECEIRKFQVLPGKDGTIDAQLCGEECRLQVETKIESGTLSDQQVKAHLKRLQEHPEKLKRLVLLTPDDGRSSYIQQFLAIDPKQLLHLEWRK